MRETRIEYYQQDRCCTRSHTIHQAADATDGMMWQQQFNSSIMLATLRHYKACIMQCHIYMELAVQFLNSLLALSALWEHHLDWKRNTLNKTRTFFIPPTTFIWHAWWRNGDSIQAGHRVGCVKLLLFRVYSPAGG